MPKPRPTRVTILEYHESAANYEMWVDVAGTRVWIGGSLDAITDRKLVYGHAKLVHHVDETQSPRSMEVVDLVPDAEALALQHLVEETLDRYEENNADIHAEPWGGPELHRANPAFTERQDHKDRALTVGRTAPEKQDPVPERRQMEDTRTTIQED